MGIRPSSQSNPTAVTQHIGTDMDTVRSVATNIEILKIVANGMDISRRYLGAYSIPPTLRPDTTPLQDGDFYFDTTNGVEGLSYYDLVDTTWKKDAGSGSVASVNAKTGVVVLNKTDIGLSNVDNTSDVSKPISSLTQTALDGKVDDDQVLTNVPLGAIFTDTTYSVGDGGLTQINFTSAYQTKLDGIEPNATADQTGSEIKIAYEAEANTNAFTDTEKSKLGGISAGAQVNTVDSVSGKTGTVTLVKDDVGLSNVDNTSDISKPISTATQIALDLKVNNSAKGVANGIATLDGAGKVPASQLPVTGGGIPDAPADGSQYARQDNTWTIVTGTGGAVDSVFGRTGAVVAQSGDYSIYYATTAQGVKADSALQDITGQSINNLSDVLSTMSPMDGQILTYDSTNGWQAENAPATGASAWGDLTGTLSNQSDLQTALDAKLDASVQVAIDLNTAKVSNVDHPLVETAVPVGAVFTDTTYLVGDGGLTEKNFTIANNSKLDGIEVNANNYTHPVSHSPSIITQDTNNRFVTDAEKAAWNNKADSVSTTEIVIPHTVSGELTAGGRENQLRDSGAFTLPLANSVAANTVCLVTLPDEYQASNPTVTRTGTDLIQHEGSTDTVVNIAGSVMVIFTSNGIDKWFLDVVSGSRGADGINGINMPTEVVSEFPGSPVTGTLYIKV